MSHIDRIIAEIDAVEPMFVSGEVLMLIEEQVWAELQESVDLGFRDIDDATREFIAWRELYRPIGSLATRRAVDKL